MAQPKTTHLSFRVRGRVQGVGFRAFTRDHARRYGLRGWVCNEASGCVAGYATGAPAAVEALMAAVREGPRFAEVTDLESAPARADDTLGPTFEIRRS